VVVANKKKDPDFEAALRHKKAGEFGARSGYGPQTICLEERKGVANLGKIVQRSMSLGHFSYLYHVFVIVDFRLPSGPGCNPDLPS